MTIGIYADIPEAKYHALPYMSNSMLKVLDQDALEFWYRSWLNPERPEQTTSSAMDLGSALDAALLEPERFAKEWRIAPDIADYENVIRSVEDAKSWLDFNGLKKTGNKPELLQRIRDESSSVVIWDDVVEAFNAGREAGEYHEIKKDDLSEIELMVARLRNNADVAAAMAGMVSQVTLLWEEDGVQCKARLDGLKPSLIMDLKSFSVKGSKSISRTVADAIVYEKYNIQWVWYRRGLERVKEAIREGKAEISGVSPEFISALLDHDQRFLLVFCRTAAPYQIRLRELRHSIGCGTPNVYFLEAGLMIDRALRKYVDLMEKYGTNPWEDGEGAEFLDDEDMPNILYQSRG